jgi:hypothetical protein
MKEFLNDSSIPPITWDQILNEHWRQFKLACQSMNHGEQMPQLNWREYILYDLCRRHNQEIGKEYFKFDDE